MYPTNLYAIDWEVIDFRYIISNINNIDFQLGPLPPSFRKFDATDTNKTKGSSNDEHIDHPSRRKAIKTKGSKVQNKPTLSKWRLQDNKELINFSGHKVQNHPKHACLLWETRGFCFSDFLQKDYHVKSHSENCKASISKHIFAKVRLGKK